MDASRVRYEYFSRASQYGFIPCPGGRRVSGGSWPMSGTRRDRARRGDGHPDEIEAAQGAAPRLWRPDGAARHRCGARTRPARIVVVIGHGGGRAGALAAPDITFVEQTKSSTARAKRVRRCEAALDGCDEVMVLNGDCPLVTGALLRRLQAARGDSPLALVSRWHRRSGRLGRVARDGRGAITGIVEAADYAGPDGPGRSTPASTCSTRPGSGARSPHCPMSQQGRVLPDRT